MTMNHGRRISSFERDLWHIFRQRSSIGNERMPQSVSFPSDADLLCTMSVDNRQVGERTDFPRIFTVRKKPGVKIICNGNDSARFALRDAVGHDDMPFGEIKMLPF